MEFQSQISALQSKEKRLNDRIKAMEALLEASKQSSADMSVQHSVSLENILINKIINIDSGAHFKNMFHIRWGRW